MSMITGDLINAIKQDRCIFFLGAGMSVTSGIPLSTELKRELYEKYRKDYPNINDNDTLSQLADKCEGSLDSFKSDIAKKLISKLRYTTTEYRLLTLLAKKLNLEIYTMNYDLQLENSFERYGLNLYNKYYYNSDAVLGGNTSIIKLAGDITNTREMLVTKKELTSINVSKGMQYFEDRVGRGCKVVFIGYSMADDVLSKAFMQINATNGYYVGLPNSCPKGLTQTCNTAQTFFCELIQRCGIVFKVAHIKFDGKHFGGIETYLSHIFNLSKQAQNFENAFFNIYSTGLDIVTNKKKFGFPLIKGAAAVTFFKAIEKGEYDLYHCHDFISAYHAQMLGVPVVYTSHSLASKELQGSDDFYNRRNEIEQLEKMYYPMIHNIVTLSSAHKNELPSFSNLHAKKLGVPFDFETINQMSKKISKEQARESIYGINNDDFVILYIGRADIRKGYHYLIEAFEKLKITHQNYKLKLLLVMPGVSKNDNGEINIVSTSTASGSSVPNNKQVRFLTSDINSIVSESCEWSSNMMSDGKVDEERFCTEFKTHYEGIIKFYKAADLLVIPSLYEPLGYVALEAMACKCPIIANKVDGLAETLTFKDVEFATFCNLGNNPNYPYAGDEVYKAIFNCIEVSNGKLILKENVTKQAEKGYRHIENTYSEKYSSEYIRDLHKLYMQAIIDSASLEYSFHYNNTALKETFDKVCNAILSYYLNDATDITTIVKRAGQIYMDLSMLQIKMERPKDLLGNKNVQIITMENYALFWWIAGKIQIMKANVTAIAQMDVRTLAETITEITRSQTNDLRSYFSLMDIETFATTDLAEIQNLIPNSYENSKYNPTTTQRNTQSPSEFNFYNYGRQKEIIWNIINNMVRIEETDFMFGGSHSDKKVLKIEIPQRKVHLSPYYICRFQVTQKEWRMILYNQPTNEENANLPIYNISYTDCCKFIEKLNSLCRSSDYKFDLPTEAQWECAAKCATDNYLYSGSDNLLEVGWFRGNTDKPQKVGLLKENRWGLFDMSGNVQEYCKDTFSEKLPDGDKDPYTMDNSILDYVTRGGSAAKQASCCRITNRYDRYNKNFRCSDNSCYIGLRLTLQYKRNYI